MKLVMFYVIAAFWMFLGVQGCTDGGMAAENLSCANITPGNEPVQPPQERNTAMPDNAQQIADGGDTQAQAAAVVKLKTATFALG